MKPNGYSDEILMAYADGELDAETAAKVEAAAAQDDSIAERIAMFARTRTALREASAARPIDEVSPELIARVRGAFAGSDSGGESREANNNVSSLRAPAQARALRPMAIAASIAFIVGVAGGALWPLFFAERGQDGLGFASLSEPQIEKALGSVGAGERVRMNGGEFRAIASFQNGDGEFCREFAFDGEGRAAVVSVACRVGRAWETRFAVLAAGDAGAAYAPASSLETLDAYLAAIGAGAPLSKEEEARRLEALIE